MPPRRFVTIGRRQVLLDQVPHVGQGRKIHNGWDRQWPRQGPFRTHIDPSQDGAEIVNGVADRVRAEMLRRIGLEDLLSPRVFGGPQKAIGRRAFCGSIAAP